MKVINALANYTALDSVQAKYFFGYTGGENPKEVATGKQLWKAQDLANRIYHLYLTIETVSDPIDNDNLQSHMKETKQAIDECTQISLPLSKENMGRKIELLTQLLDSTLPKLSGIVQKAINKSA